MIHGYCQYGEEQFIEPVFHGMGRRGVVVDVGAGDGEFLSHSRGLIQAGWFGVLIDPLPVHIGKLRQLYDGCERVKIIQSAVAEDAGEVVMYEALADPYNSTLVPSWRKLAESHGEPYRPITVRAYRLDTLLATHGVREIDFLTIDAEMMDEHVLRSNDWTRWRPRLVCAECGVPSSCDDFMRSIGYKFHGRSRANTFWIFQ